MGTLAANPQTAGKWTPGAGSAQPVTRHLCVCSHCHHQSITLARPTRHFLCVTSDAADRALGDLKPRGALSDVTSPDAMRVHDPRTGRRVLASWPSPVLLRLASSRTPRRDFLCSAVTSVVKEDDNRRTARLVARGITSYHWPAAHRREARQSCFRFLRAVASCERPNSRRRPLIGGSLPNALCDGERTPNATGVR